VEVSVTASDLIITETSCLTTRERHRIQVIFLTICHGIFLATFFLDRQSIRISFLLDHFERLCYYQNVTLKM